MKLMFKGEEITSYGSGWFFVDLGSKKMHEVYEEQKRRFMIEDIAAAVEEKIQENGMGDRYASDWPTRFGDRFASKAVAAVDGNEQIQELYSHEVNRQVEAGLESLGIDPDTMLHIEEADQKPNHGLNAGDGYS